MKNKIFEFGFASIPLVLGLLILAIATPLSVKLVQQNQDRRSSAANDGSCYAPKLNQKVTDGSFICSDSGYGDFNTVSKCSYGSIVTQFNCGLIGCVYSSKVDSGNGILKTDAVCRNDDRCKNKKGTCNALNSATNGASCITSDGKTGKVESNLCFGTLDKKCCVPDGSNTVVTKCIDIKNESTCNNSGQCKWVNGICTNKNQESVCTILFYSQRRPGYKSCWPGEKKVVLCQGIDYPWKDVYDCGAKGGKCVMDNGDKLTGNARCQCSFNGQYYDPGKAICNANTMMKCNNDASWSSSNCPNGCENGKCKTTPIPTSTVSCNSKGGTCVTSYSGMQSGITCSLGGGKSGKTNVSYKCSTGLVCCVPNGGINPTPTPIKVNGACGSTKNACKAGTFSDVSDSSTYYRWNCKGSNGGSTASCSVKKIVTPTPTPISKPTCKSKGGACVRSAGTCTVVEEGKVITGVTGCSGSTPVCCKL